MKISQRLGSRFSLLWRWFWPRDHRFSVLGFNYWWISLLYLVLLLGFVGDISRIFQVFVGLKVVLVELFHCLTLECSCSIVFF